MMQPISLQTLNKSSEPEFVNTLGGIFEHSPWVAERVYADRPFDSINTLLEKMISTVYEASQQQRHTLICNHPELAGSEAQENNLTNESKSEQESAGLNNCSTDELQRLRQLNKQYQQKFGFPFVIAVKQLTRYDILDAIAKRINNSQQHEFDSCIDEIAKIATFRLHEIVTD